MRRHVGIPRAIDELPRGEGGTPRFGFHQHRGEVPRVAHYHAGDPGVQQHPGPRRGEELIRGDLVGGGVVGLGGDAVAEQQVRRVEPAQAVDAGQQFGADSLDDAADRAMHVAVHAAEVGHARRGAHAPQEAVAFHQQGARAVPCRSGCRRQPRGAAPQDEDVDFVEQRRMPRGLRDRGVGCQTHDGERLQRFVAAAQPRLRDLREGGNAWAWMRHELWTRLMLYTACEYTSCCALFHWSHFALESRQSCV
ncbi:hypothetical protein CDEF62S_01290 [Castellaniella defragrans]